MTWSMPGKSSDSRRGNAGPLHATATLDAAMRASPHPQEPERLRALARYAMLDTPAEASTLR